jgi:hypothetical protein
MRIRTPVPERLAPGLAEAAQAETVPVQAEQAERRGQLFPRHSMWPPTRRLLAMWLRGMWARTLVPGLAVPIQTEAA